MSELSLDCSSCTAAMKIDRGCERKSLVPGRWQIEEYSFQRCPLKVIDRDIFWFIKAYNFLEHGVLPNSGGWMNQANKFIEAMEVIGAEVSKIQKQRKS